MPRIDYGEIRSKIIEILTADQDIVGLSFNDGDINIEDIFEPAAIIELERRTQAPGQPIAAGTKVRYFIEGSIVVMTASLEKSVANDLRDDFISKIEVSLLRNPKLDNLVSMIFLQGGELISGFNENGGYYISGGEVRLTIDATVSI